MYLRPTALSRGLLGAIWLCQRVRVEEPALPKKNSNLQGVLQSQQEIRDRGPETTQSETFEKSECWQRP